MLDVILARIPRVEHVVEPFGGGLSVSFRLVARGATVSAYDIDRALIAFWQCFGCDRHRLYDAILRLMPMTDVRFTELRDALDVLPVGFELAAAFYAVQRYSFGALGAAGGPAPARGRFHKNTMRPLLSNRLNGISVQCGDFRDTIPQHKNDFLYVDPPYLFEDASKNCLYGRNGKHHRNFDHGALFDLLKDRTGWLLSYGDNATIRDLYDGFPIEKFDHQYTGATKVVGRELLIHPRTGLGRAV